MSYIEKEKLIKADIASIENRVRHAFNQGYDLGYKEGKERAKPQEQEPTTKYCDRSICLKNEYNNIGCEDCEVTKSQERTTKDDLAFTSGLEKNSQKLEKNFGELDCISREQALEPYKILENTDTLSVYTIRQNLAELPSVTPQEPKTGHWINKQHSFESCSAECSSCHKRSNGYLHDNGFSLVSKYFDFCSKCGSDNREVEE